MFSSLGREDRLTLAASIISVNLDHSMQHTSRTPSRRQRGHALGDPLGVGTERKLGGRGSSIDSHRFGGDCQGRDCEDE